MTRLNNLEDLVNHNNL
jgi:hypothetical protein